MKIFNAYFKQHFLSTLVRPVVFSVLGLLILLITCNTEYMSWTQNYSEVLITKSLLMYITSFAAIVAILVPILEFSAFNNKKNIDTLFSLPLDKSKMLLLHYLNGALQIVLSITVVYAVWLITWVYAPYTKLHEGYSFLAYPFIIVCSMIVYTIYSFIFLQANTTVDGCAFVFLYIFVFFMLTSTVYQIVFTYYDVGSNFIRNEFNKIVASSFPTSVLGRLAVFFNKLIIPNSTWITLDGGNQSIRVYEYTKIADVFSGIDSTRYVYIFFIAFAAMGAYVTVKTFKKRSPLNVGEISESWFGYKVLGPIFSICGVLLFNSDSSIFDFPFSIIVLIIMFLGYMLYRRGVKFKIPDIVVMAIAVLLTIFGVSIY